MRYLKLLLLLAPFCLAADTPKLDSALWIPPKARVTFTAKPNQPPPVVIVTITGATLRTAGPVAVGGSLKTLDYPLAVAVPDGDDPKQVCIADANSTPTADCVDFIKSEDTVVDLMKKVPRPQSQQNIFASGLATTGPSGTVGAADLNLNGGLASIRGLTGFLQLKKATQNGADPKNFEAGFHYTSGKPFGSPETTGTLAAWLFDIAMKSEGTASKFGVDNIVGDATVQLQSRVLAVGSRGTNGFPGHAKFRLVGGFEGGSNQSKGDAPVDGTLFQPLRNVDWIARSKLGLDGSLHYHNNGRAFLPFSLVELHAEGIARNLFADELRYDATTDKVDKIARGIRAWVQVDLKLMVASTPQGNYGFKLTYQRGSLPPVFANTKTLQFGFVFETGDPAEKK